MTRVISFPRFNPRFRTTSGGYQRSVLGLNPLAFWPMDELSGTTAFDRSGNGYNGAYTGVELGQAGQFGRTCPLWAGNDFNNVYSAGFVGAFSGAEGTLACWIKVAAASVWADSTARYVCQFTVDADNFTYLRKSATNNFLTYYYEAGNTAETVNLDTGGNIGWIHVAQTWSASNNQFIAYYNGAQTGTTQTGLGAWSGTPTSIRSVIGASVITPGDVWSGWLQYAAIWTRALAPAEILRLYTG